MLVAVPTAHRPSLSCMGRSYACVDGEESEWVSERVDDGWMDGRMEWNAAPRDMSCTCPAAVQTTSNMGESTNHTRFPK